VRARDLGIVLGELEPGPLNAITDVPGVSVGQTTLVEGEDVRTGVTVVLPTADGSPCFAGSHRLNGNGELTGLEWVRESGFLTTPVALTNTFSVGVVRDAIVSSQHAAGRGRWHLPVVGETYDGLLNDIEGMHVRPEHVWAALDSASTGQVAEGAIGGGTGMICHGFKGGIGTASRTIEHGVVGVLVQANHGRRSRLVIEGVPVGRELGPERIPLPPRPDVGSGSIIVLAATDAPLLPHQCERLAVRAGLGIARTGGAGENSSGDLVLAFAVGNRINGGVREPLPLRMLPNDVIDTLFYAVIEATEEAIVNALVAAETMSGRGGAVVHQLDHELLCEVMSRYGRLAARAGASRTKDT
jgi:D-aminopeptidase